VSLFLALLFFSMGVIVGRYDKIAPASRPAPVAQAPVETPRPAPPAARNTLASKAQTDGEGIQKSPRPVPMPAADAQTPGLPAPPSESQRIPQRGDSPQDNGQELTTAPPAGTTTIVTGPPEDEQKPIAPAEPTPLPGSPPPEPTESSDKDAQDKTTAKSEDKGKTPPADHAETVPEGAVANVPKPASRSTIEGAYVIQVAAFFGAEKNRLAEAVRKRLKENANLDSQIVPSEDGKAVRVVMGGYPDRESAQKACSELKKREGFADSFVRRR